MVRTIRAWLPAAIVLTVACGLVQVAVQQAYRMSANDPQIQIAEDTAAALAAGGDAHALVGSSTVDMAQSLAPWLTVTDGLGNLVASSATLDGQQPVPPTGSLAAAQANGRNMVTWQPVPYVRMATVIVPYSGSNVSGFIIAGRSLREVEVREANLTTLLGLAWTIGLVATLVAATLGGRPATS